ncbi:hypothetical protein [Pinibacter aurantiacus]|nr:hypothetical protein [Pinibacter aurantiacus]
MNRELLEQNIERIELLKYVKSEQRGDVLEGLINNIVNKNAFFFSYAEFENIDGRLFSFDAEELVEGGALDLFNEMRPYFEKAGLKLNNVEQAFDCSSKKVIYNLKINKYTCNLAKGPSSFLLVYIFLTAKYAMFLNKILRKNKVKERIYFMNDSASDTQIAFLTPKQAKFINSLKLNPKDEVYKWNYWTACKMIFEGVGFIFKILFRKKRVEQ